MAVEVVVVAHDDLVTDEEEETVSRSGNRTGEDPAGVPSVYKEKTKAFLLYITRDNKF